MAEQEEPATLPQVFLPEPRNRSLHIYSGLGRWGIKNAPGCIPNYPKIIFWLLKDFQPLLPTSPPNFLFQKRLVKASVFASKRANATANPWHHYGIQKVLGRGKTTDLKGNFSWGEILEACGEIFWCELFKRLKCSISPWQGEMSCQKPRERKKMFFVIEKLFDKLPDIMGPISLPFRSGK